MRGEGEKRRETYEAVVEGGRQVLKVEPDVEGRLWGHGDLEAQPLETLEDVVALSFEVPLQSNLLLLYVLRVQERDGSELQTVDKRTIVRKTAQLHYEDTHG